MYRNGGSVINASVACTPPGVKILEICDLFPACPYLLYVCFVMLYYLCYIANATFVFWFIMLEDGCFIKKTYMNHIYLISLFNYLWKAN